MVNGIINGFMKVSGQNYLEHSSYALSKFFFEELKKLSPPKLHHIWGQRRHQKLRLAFIFNMTIQLFVEFKNRGARAKPKILKFWPGNFTFIWFQIKSQILSFALAPLFLNTTKSWMQGDQTALYFKGRPVYRAFVLYYPVFALYLSESPVFLRRNGK